VHTGCHKEMLQQLEGTLLRLRRFGLKMNAAKSIFGTSEVQYLGYTLRPEGVSPSKDKLGALRAFPPPTSPKQIREFVGICNYFRFLVPSFSRRAAPLLKLTRATAEWKEGPLPPEALTGFQDLKKALISEPIVGHPAREQRHTEAHQGNSGMEVRAAPARGADSVSGPQESTHLGADRGPPGEGQEVHSAYGRSTGRRSQCRGSRGSPDAGGRRRQRQGHCLRVTPAKRVREELLGIPLEMQAAVFRIEHFDVYLQGKQFTLFTDHKPIEKLGTVHKRTLNRLQVLMTEYDFTMQYRRGCDNAVADFLSRNAPSAGGDRQRLNGLLGQRGADVARCRRHLGHHRRRGVGGDGAAQG
jgi:hypothetical protein